MVEGANIVMGVLCYTLLYTPGHRPRRATRSDKGKVFVRSFLLFRCKVSVQMSRRGAWRSGTPSDGGPDKLECSPDPPRPGVLDADPDVLRHARARVCLHSVQLQQSGAPARDDAPILLQQPVERGRSGGFVVQFGAVVAQQESERVATRVGRPAGPGPPLPPRSRCNECVGLGQRPATPAISSTSTAAEGKGRRGGSPARSIPRDA